MSPNESSVVRVMCPFKYEGLWGHDVGTGAIDDEVGAGGIGCGRDSPCPADDIIACPSYVSQRRRFRLICFVSVSAGRFVILFSGCSVGLKCWKKEEILHYFLLVCYWF